MQVSYPPLAWWALKRDKNTRYYAYFRCQKHKNNTPGLFSPIRCLLGTFVTLARQMIHPFSSCRGKFSYLKCQGPYFSRDFEIYTHFPPLFDLCMQKLRQEHVWGRFWSFFAKRIAASKSSRWKSDGIWLGVGANCKGISHLGKPSFCPP